MKGRTAVLVVTALLFSLHATLVAGTIVGQVDSIPEAVSCPRCTFEFGPAVVLGRDLPDGGLSGVPQAVVVDSRGRFWVTVGADLAEMPYVFDAAGRFIGQVGRAGYGPGEFRYPGVAAVLPGDTVAIVDLAAARISLVGPDLDYVRSWRIPPAVHGIAVTLEGKIILAANVPDATRVGVPLHRFGADGTYETSFGESPAPIIPGRTQPQFRVLAPARSGGIWSASRFSRYDLERFDSGGSRLAGYTRGPDWFVSRSSEASGRLRPPLPGVRALHEDGRGRLWVLVQVPDPRWRQAFRFPERPRTEREAQPAVINPDLMVDVYLEVIDVAQGAVVARRHFDESFDGFLTDGRLYRFRQDTLDLVTIEIRAVELVEP